MLDNKPILQSDAVAGVLTHSHLSLGRKENGYEPQWCMPKDLRLIYPSLKRLVLIDNSHLGVLAFAFARSAPLSRAWICNPGPTQASLYRQVLSTVKNEVDEALRYQSTHKGVEFSVASFALHRDGQVGCRGIIQAWKNE
jgi:hypothetical protein